MQNNDIRMFSLRFFYSLFFFACIALILGSCSGANQSSFIPNTSSSEAENPGLEEAADSTYIKVIPSTNLGYLYSYNRSYPAFAAGTDCSISMTDTTHRDYECILDLSEFDLYYQGVSFDMIVPPETCNYFSFSNYYYYNFETGYGASDMQVTLTYDAADALTTTVCDIDGNATCDDGETSIPINAGVVSPPECVYNHTATDDAYPNCCLGKGTLTVTEDHTASGGDLTTSEQDVSWGGVIGNCLAGPPVADSDWPKDVDGVPLTQVYNTYDSGLSVRYNISAPLTVHGFGGNVSVANFYSYESGVDERHAHTGPTVSRTSYAPIFVDPIEDRSGDSLSSGNEAYTFRCLDAALETMHKITIFVREWDTVANFTSYLASPVESPSASADYDQSGTQGGSGSEDCDGVFGEPCNDIFDIDDLAPATPPVSPPYSSGTFPQETTL